MRKPYLICQLGIMALLAVAFQSCKKENGIDNDTVLKKPYGLFIGTDQGALLNTSNGTDYKTIFPPDGYPSRAIVTSGMNIIWAKANLHLSENNGKNFNPTYYYVNAYFDPTNPYFPAQQVILSARNQNRVYVASYDPGARGIALSDDNGKTWNAETLFDIGIANTLYTSFTQQANGLIYTHNSLNDSIYQKDDRNDSWTHRPYVSGLPTDFHNFYLSHVANTLVLVDQWGNEGAYYSNDSGKNWTKYAGLPKQFLYAAYAPFEETLLIGTDSMGIYRLQAGAFVPSNNGLETNTTVYSIVAKEDIYKNDVSKRYVYIATNKGIYRSEDMGLNWDLIKEGSFVAVY